MKGINDFLTSIKILFTCISLFWLYPVLFHITYKRSYNQMILIHESNIYIYSEIHKLFLAHKPGKNSLEFWTILKILLSFYENQNNNLIYSRILVFLILSLYKEKDMMMQHQSILYKCVNYLEIFYSCIYNILS